MIEFLQSYTTLILSSIFFGIFAKIADLLDEHQMRLFRGAPILFGVLSGLFGFLIILSHQSTASNFYLALLIHWILRYRIDHLNHGIAASMMFISLVIQVNTYHIDWILFLVIFLGYSFHGLLNDAADQGKINGICAQYFQSNTHYVTIPLLLTIINAQYWIVLTMSLLHVLFYEATKKVGMAFLEKKRDRSFQNSPEQ